MIDGKAKVVYLSCFGTLYRLTPRQARRYFAAVANDEHPGLDDYGKCVGYVENVTDTSAEEARDHLKELEGR